MTAMAVVAALVVPVSVLVAAGWSSLRDARSARDGVDRAEVVPVVTVPPEEVAPGALALRLAWRAEADRVEAASGRWVSSRATSGRGAAPVHVDRVG